MHQDVYSATHPVDRIPAPWCRSALRATLSQAISEGFRLACDHPSLSQAMKGYAIARRDVPEEAFDALESTADRLLYEASCRWPERWSKEEVALCLMDGIEKALVSGAAACGSAVGDGGVERSADLSVAHLARDPVWLAAAVKPLVDEIEAALKQADAPIRRPRRRLLAKAGVIRASATEDGWEWVVHRGVDGEPLWVARKAVGSETFEVVYGRAS